MKAYRIPSFLLVLQAALLWGATSASGQSIGVGAGLAMANDKIAQVTADLASRGWSAAAENAGNGYYVELRGRFGGQLALIGSVGYSSFGRTHSQYFDGSSRSVDLVTSQTIIPVTIGADMRLSEGFLVPYLTLEASYNHYYRAFERSVGDLSVPFDIQSEGDARFGAAVGAGLALDLKIAELDIGGRLHLPNLINAEPSESEVYYLQLGATLYVRL